LMSGEDPTEPQELVLLDQIAEWTIQPDLHFLQIREFFQEDERVQPRPGWTP
jgi:hypothetical protein